MNLGNTFLFTSNLFRNGHTTCFWLMEMQAKKICVGFKESFCLPDTAKRLDDKAIDFPFSLYPGGEPGTWRCGDHNGAMGQQV